MSGPVIKISDFSTAGMNRFSRWWHIRRANWLRPAYYWFRLHCWVDGVKVTEDLGWTGPIKVSTFSLGGK